MTHDIEDLLELIMMLEKRIIYLEKKLSGDPAGSIPDDSYYWEHG